MLAVTMLVLTCIAFFTTSFIAEFLFYEEKGKALAIIAQEAAPILMKVLGKRWI
jgi:hypothetical protein